MPAALPFVDRSVRTALRRLVGQTLLNQLAGWLALSTGLTLAWFVLQPLLLESPPVWLRWAVLSGSGVVGVGMAVWQTVKAAPTRRGAALEVDHRFDLRERVTTALELDDELRTTPAGRALSADAEARAKKISVKSKFPVKPRWTAALAPLFALAIAAVVLWWNPNPLNFGGGPDTAKEKKVETGRPDLLTPEQQKKKEEEQKKLDDLAARKDRDPTLAAFEQELKDQQAKYDKDKYDSGPEKAQEKAAETAKYEEKVEKYAKQKEAEVKQLAETLGQLDKLANDKEFEKKDDPGAKLSDDLSKGELQKAEDELEGLEDKAKDKGLEKEEAEKLGKQLDKIDKALEDEVERLEKDRDKKKDELEREKDKAKEDGNKEEEEQLDRELEKLEQEKQAGQDSKDLAEELKEAKDALEKGDQQQAAQALKKARATVKKMRAKDGDSQEAQARAQQAKAQAKAAAKAAEAARKGDKGDQAVGKGEGDKGEKGLKPGDGDKNKGGVGEGLRPENKDAKTAAEETRIRSLQDKMGESKFGGTAKDDQKKKFEKVSDRTLGSAIQKAAQDAPGAADVQRLPREAKESVAEYFKNLGGGK